MAISPSKLYQKTAPGYGDFILRADLQTLDTLPAPQC